MMTEDAKKENRLARTDEVPMARTIWFDPWEDLDRFFDDPFFFPSSRRTSRRPRIAVGVPNVDISDEQDHILIRADMPGVPKENVEVHVQDDVLEIRARQDEAEETTEDNLIRRERRTSSFQRQFVLPDTLRTEKIKATMKDGVLTIHIPKMEPKTPKKVPIKVE